MAGGKADYLEAAQINEVLGGTAFSAPATVYMALFSASPSDGVAGTELSGSAYARVAITNNTTNFPAGNPKSNGTAITFPQATADWLRAYSWALSDASTAGNTLYWGPLAQNIKNCNVDATDVTNDTITSPAHGFVDNDIVRIFKHQGGTLPTGISEDTRYFVVSSATDTFKVSATQGGSAINITAVGSGFLEVGLDKSVLITSSGQASFAAGELVITED